MNKKHLILFFILFTIECIAFRNYILPNRWSPIKVTGQACTACPDEIILEGTEFIASITPDSLKKYNLKYHEMFLSTFNIDDTDNPHWLKGKVVGKAYDGSNWYPKFEITDYISGLAVYFIRGFLLLQVLYLVLRFLYMRFVYI